MASREEHYEKWISALRSGEYSQGAHALKTDVGYCCLGVANEVCFGATWGRMRDRDRGQVYADDEGYVAVPSNERLNELDLKALLTEADIRLAERYLSVLTTEGQLRWLTDEPRNVLLTHMNDEGVSFEHIAEFLEKSGWVN